MSAELIQNAIAEEKNDLRSFISELRHQENRYLLRNDILNAYKDYCAKYQKGEEDYYFFHFSLNYCS